MPISVRPAEEADLPALLTLYHYLNPADPPLTKEEAETRFVEMLAQPGMSVICAFTGEVMAATCTLVIIPNLTRGAAPYAFIENVVTHPGYRRIGAGRAVIGHATELADDAGCYKLMLLTGRADPGVWAFYESCGFKQDKTGFQIRFDLVA